MEEGLGGPTRFEVAIKELWLEEHGEVELPSTVVERQELLESARERVEVLARELGDHNIEL